MDLNRLRSPLMVCWQLTRECDLSCLHCCTESGPGCALPGELGREQALRLAGDIIECGVPYVMLCGGEPLSAEHFFDVAERLGEAGVRLKLETNGQRFGPREARRLAALPVRSVQVSLDGDTDGAYRSLRPGASLAAAHAACRAAQEAGLPLEITFAPTKDNIHEASAVVDRSLSLGAFRFNTGMLMHAGRAQRFWERLVPAPEQYHGFFSMMERRRLELAGRMELCFEPRSLEEALSLQLRQPPATLLVGPDGLVRVSAARSYICADLGTQTLSRAWSAYIAAWENIRRLESLPPVLPPDGSRAVFSGSFREGAPAAVAGAAVR